MHSLAANKLEEDAKSRNKESFPEFIFFFILFNNMSCNICHVIFAGCVDLYKIFQVFFFRKASNNCLHNFKKGGRIIRQIVYQN